jgi:hypothetical protein
MTDLDRLVAEASSVQHISDYLGTLFEPSDYVTFRPIETWVEHGKKKSRVLYKDICSIPQHAWLNGIMASRLASLEAEHGNAFVGVCPRQSGAGTFELAWQIPIVRTLWADVDGCSVEEACQRIRNAKLPDPTVIVSSGNGGHFYWKLEEPVLTGAPAIGVFQSWTEIKGKKRPIRFIGSDEDPIWLDDMAAGKAIPNNQPPLTEIALRVQDTCQGIAAAIGGDHTQDLSRLLRLPGTMNRKNGRNGAEPKPCVLIEADATRRYSFESFAKFADQAPSKKRRDVVARIPLPVSRPLTAAKIDTLNGKLFACGNSTGRSAADFSLCCWAIEKGVAQADVWEKCQGIGKFAERGESYFESTWLRAAERTREQLFENSIPASTEETPGEKCPDGERDELPDNAVEISLNELAVNDAVISILARSNDLYDAHGQLATIVNVTDDDGRIRAAIHVLGLSGLREHISDRVKFFTWEVDKETGEEVPKWQRIPRWCYEAILVRGVWAGIRPIRGIVTSPVLRADGSILETPGYDPTSGLFVELTEEFPSIVSEPSIDDVHNAVSLLLDLVSDFPFASLPNKSAWLGSLLTPLAREAYHGPTGPLFLFDANTRGSGKSLLCDINSLIVSGREATRFTAPRDDEEARKRITALVNDTDRIVLIDNIAGRFGCAALDAALTGAVWKDRRLGHTELIESPLRMTWYASGNNVILAADTARRVCHVRLESPLENPEDRAGFQHVDIKKHVRRNRPALLTAALTILRGYIVAGRPDQKLKPWGSFEGWSDLVRGAIVWAGLADPGETRTILRSTSDSEAGSLRQMLIAIQTVDPSGHGLRTSDILKIAEGRAQAFSTEDATLLKEATETFCGTTLSKTTTQKLGNQLSHFRNRVVDQMAFNCVTRKGTNYWFVVSRGGPVGPGGPVSPISYAHKEQKYLEENTYTEAPQEWG